MARIHIDRGFLGREALCENKLPEQEQCKQTWMVINNNSKGTGSYTSGVR